MQVTQKTVVRRMKLNSPVAKFLLEQQFLSPREAALVLGCRPETILSWIKTGRLTAQQFVYNGRWFIPRREIDQFFRPAKPIKGNRVV